MHNDNVAVHGCLPQIFEYIMFLSELQARERRLILELVQQVAPRPEHPPVQEAAPGPAKRVNLAVALSSNKSTD